MSHDGSLNPAPLLRRERIAAIGPRGRISKSLPSKNAPPRARARVVVSKADLRSVGSAPRRAPSFLFYFPCLFLLARYLVLLSAVRARCGHQDIRGLAARGL